jgi:hypothetical protein
MKRLIRAVLPALLAITLGVSLEWLLLTGSSPQAVIATIQGPTATPVVEYRRPEFQTGVVFIQWGQQGYGPRNPNWQVGLDEIRQQTAARWIEMPINFYQDTTTSLTFTPSSATPTPESVYEGVHAAHVMGYHVFVVPLITVKTVAWAGFIGFPRAAGYRAWFASYWKLLQPYAEAAAAGGADQFAIGTEYAGLETAPDALWDTLIANVRSVFPGTITYDMNFTSMSLPIRHWMRNPDLKYIGISEYLGLTSVRMRVDPEVVAPLWRLWILSKLDRFAERLGRPIILSEIGYRNSTDALFNPYDHATKAHPDPQEQAAAYDAALQNVIPDPNIEGIYFWAWSLPYFQPNWQPAAAVLHKWYNSPQA